MPGVATTEEICFAPIERVDLDKREVWGYATSENLARDGRILGLEGSIKAFEGWHKNLREMHSPFKAVGRGIAFEPDYDLRRIWVGVRISRGAEDTWQKVLDGTLRGFSVKGNIIAAQNRKIERGGRGMLVPYVTAWEMVELSLVDVPSDPVGVFQQIVRSIADSEISDGSTILRASRMHGAMVGQHSHDHPGYDMTSNNPMRPHNHLHRHGTEGTEGSDAIPDAHHGHGHEGAFAVDKKTVSRADDTPAASDVDVSDGGTHGACNGAHSHEHSCNGEMATHEHSHDGDGDHNGHEVERAAATTPDAGQSALLAQTDATLAAARSAMVAAYSTRNTITRSAGAAVEEQHTARGQSIVENLKALRAAEAAEPDATEEAPEIKALDQAIALVQKVTASESREAAEAASIARNAQEEPMDAATVEILRGLSAAVTTLNERLEKTTTAAPAAVETPVEAQTVERGAATPDMGEVVRGLQATVENLTSEIATIKKTPAQNGPLLHTGQVNVAEKWFGSDGVPTAPANVERAFTEIALNATDRSVRERAELAAVYEGVKGVRAATHGRLTQQP